MVDIFDSLARAQEAYIHQHTVQSSNNKAGNGQTAQGKNSKVGESKLEDSDSKTGAGGRREGDKGSGAKGATEKGQDDDDDNEERDSPPRPSAAWKEVVVVEQVCGGTGAGADQQMTKLTVSLSFPGENAKIPLVWTASVSSLRPPSSPAKVSVNANANAQQAVTAPSTATAGVAATVAVMSDEERVDGWILELRRLVQNRPSPTDPHAASKKDGPGPGLGRQSKDEGLGAPGPGAAEEGQGLGAMWAVVRALLTCRLGSVLGAVAAGASLDLAAPSPNVSTALVLQSNNGGVVGQVKGGGGASTSTSRTATWVVQGSVKTPWLTMGGLSHIRCVVPPVTPASQTKALPAASAAAGGTGKGGVAGVTSEDMGEFVVLRENGGDRGVTAPATGPVVVCYAGNFKKVEGADVMKALQAVDRQ